MSLCGFSSLPSTGNVGASGMYPSRFGLGKFFGRTGERAKEQPSSSFVGAVEGEQHRRASHSPAELDFSAHVCFVRLLLNLSQTQTRRKSPQDFLLSPACQTSMMSPSAAVFFCRRLLGSSVGDEFWLQFGQNKQSGWPNDL